MFPPNESAGIPMAHLQFQTNMPTGLIDSAKNAVKIFATEERPYGRQPIYNSIAI
jgi:hypothetical protein